jgi:chaperone modulatory protein CbpM
MSIDEAELCRRIGIEHISWHAWIEAGWIQPLPEGGYSDQDEARARLILDLTGPLGVNGEGIAIILDLLDQIHGLRRLLRNAARSEGGLEQAPEL